MIYVKGFLLGLFMFCYAAIFIPGERWQLLARTQATKNAETSGLIDASKLGDNEQINLLLAHGADVIAADKLGITPLIAASSSLQRSAIELLLSHGAQSISKDKRGLYRV